MNESTDTENTDRHPAGYTNPPIDVAANLVDASGQPIEVPPGSPADPPAEIKLRRERVCVSFADPDMRGLVHDILAAEYPWFASMNLMFTPSGQLSDPSSIEIVASAEVTCAIPQHMTSEQVADELRAVVQVKTRERIEEIGNMLQEFGTGRARVTPNASSLDDSSAVHVGHTMPLGSVGIISDEYIVNMPPVHIASESCWCHPTENAPSMWTHNETAP